MSITVIYARKSSESEDRQALSIESQVRELKLIAARQGVSIGEVLAEAHSAKAPGRPVFGELMRRIHQGEIRGVVCWKMDRLARNHLDHGAVLQALAEGHLERVVTSDRTYTGDGNDRFIGNFELGMATKYIDDLRANVKRGNRERFSRGWVNHNPPLGYLLDPVTKEIVKDPERFDHVRRMWELLLQGAMRPDAIRALANKQWGFRTRRFKRIGGNPLSRSVLFRMYANPFYAGTIKLADGRTYPGAHPPMISAQEFDEVQLILGRPMRSRPQKHEFPFVGLMKCGYCGGAITAEQHVKKSGLRFVYYRCSRRKMEMPCREPAISASQLEEQFAELLGQVSIPPKIQAWLQEQVARELEREFPRQEQVLANLTGELDASRREEDALLTLRLRDLLSDDAFVDRRRRMHEQRDALQRQIEAAKRGTADVVADAQTVFEFAAKAKTAFLEGTPVQRRVILEAAGLNYTLASRKVALAWTEPLSVVAKAAACRDWSAMWDDVRTAVRKAGASISRKWGGDKVHEDGMPRAA
jgi:DNA invertase Pin-like site-specific DNA recombinase